MNRLSKVVGVIFNSGAVLGFFFTFFFSHASDMALGMAMLWSDWNSSTTTGLIAIKFCPHSRSWFSSAVISLTSALISMSQQQLSAAEQAWTGMSGLTCSVFVNPLYKYNGFHFQFGGCGVSTRTLRVQSSSAPSTVGNNVVRLATDFLHGLEINSRLQYVPGPESP